MAKNWTMAEAIKAIANQNVEDVKDIYRRFPVAGMLITKVVAGDTKAAFDIIANLPEWATVNKFEKALKADAPEAEEMTEVDDDAEVEDEVVEEKPVPKAKKSEKAKTVKAEVTGDSDYAKISGSKLYEMIKNAGKLKDLKAKGYGTKKVDLVAYLEKYGLDDSESAVEAEVEETEADTEESKYALLSAQDLFKECKRRKLDVKPKKPTKYYIDLLEKNDAEQTDDSDDAEDDWDAEEVVEEKPKAKKSEKKAKPEKKPAKKAESVEDDEDDDEDWDI